MMILAAAVGFLNFIRHATATRAISRPAQLTGAGLPQKGASASSFSRARALVCAAVIIL